MENGQVAELEQHLEDAKKMVERRDMAVRLYKNPEFKALIVDGFCGTECARYAQESGDPSIPAENRADALAMAQAAGHLRRYLSYLVRFGNTAEKDIPEIHEAIESARQEAIRGDLVPEGGF